MSNHMVIGARRYDFKSENGEHIEGLKVTYLDQPETGPNGIGFLPLTINAKSETWSKLEAVPGWYDLSFRQRPDSKGRPVLILDDMELLEAIEFQGR